MRLSTAAITVAIGFLVLLSCLELQTSYSLLSSSAQVPNNGTIVYDQGVVYWKADFEEGTFYDITNAGMGWGGELQTGGNGKISIVASPVFKGNYACRAEVTATGVQSYAKPVRWAPMEDYTEAYYGAALYISPDFGVTTSGWTNIMQLHETPSGSGVYVYISPMRDSKGVMHLSLRTQQPAGTYAELWRDTNPLPVGKWFTVVFYAKLTTNGLLNCWIDGQPVTGGPFSRNLAATSGQYQGPAFDAGIYQSYDCPANYVICDELICASTLEAATP